MAEFVYVAGFETVDPFGQETLGVFSDQGKAVSEVRREMDRPSQFGRTGYYVARFPVDVPIREREGEVVWEVDL